jgi:hypothetical protein
MTGIACATLLYQKEIKLSANAAFNVRLNTFC